MYLSYNTCLLLVALIITLILLHNRIHFLEVNITIIWTWYRILNHIFRIRIELPKHKIRTRITSYQIVSSRYQDWRPLPVIFIFKGPVMGRYHIFFVVSKKKLSNKVLSYRVCEAKTTTSKSTTNIALLAFCGKGFSCRYDNYYRRAESKNHFLMYCRNVGNVLEPCNHLQICKCLQISLILIPMLIAYSKTTRKNVWGEVGMGVNGRGLKWWVVLAEQLSAHCCTIISRRRYLHPIYICIHEHVTITKMLQYPKM